MCSHRPVRTRGSASSMITAVTPPMKSESGFLNTRHDTEWPYKSGLAGRSREIDVRPVAGFQERARCSV